MKKLDSCKMVCYNFRYIRIFITNLTRPFSVSCRRRVARCRFLAAVIALLLIFGQLPAAAAESPEETQMLERVRQSVVHLYAIGVSERTHLRSRWTGSGFAVGIAGTESDVFLTNWHVTTGSGMFETEEVKLWILLDHAQFDENQEPLPGCAIACQVLATTTGFPDVAVIRALEPTGCEALPLLSSRRVIDQTPVYALGFPGLEETGYGADSGPEDVDITQGVVERRLTMTSAGDTRCLIHSAAIRHGNSGGPLVNSQGAVVGLNAYGFEEAVTTELFCSVYIDYGMDMLKDLDIPYTVADGPSPITALAANILKKPDLHPLAAYALFALWLACAGAVLLCFLKFIRRAAIRIRGRFAAGKKPD